MPELDDELMRAIAGLGDDRTSGASGLVWRAASIVRLAIAGGRPVGPVAAALCRAQPSMASFWTLAAAVLAAERDPLVLDRFLERLERSTRTLVRIAAAHLAQAHEEPLRLVTISASGTVRAVIEALARQHPVHVGCTESRPALEGRRLATDLAGAGVAVTLFTDAAIGHALAGADAVIVGADAIAPGWIVNKSGTTMLAAAAGHSGVPVYAVATRDKFVPDPIAQRLTIRNERSEEVWDSPPVSVEVRNPYFERVPAELFAAVVSDVGVLGTDMLADACAARVDAPTVQTLLALLDR